MIYIYIYIFYFILFYFIFERENDKVRYMIKKEMDWPRNLFGCLISCF